MLWQFFPCKKILVQQIANFVTNISRPHPRRHAVIERRNEQIPIGLMVEADCDVLAAGSDDFQPGRQFGRKRVLLYDPARFAAKQRDHDIKHELAALAGVVLNLKIGFLASLGDKANAD
jgi:hypothetical protein